MIRIGINGFGRIGRSLTRIVSNMADVELVAVNDIDSMIHNHVYLLKSDSVYGRFDCVKHIDENQIELKGKSVKFHNYDDIVDVPWERYELDAVIDASGVERNAVNAKTLVSKGVRKVLVTHATNVVDRTIVLGANERFYRPDEDFLISTSICDTTALAPVLCALDQNYHIKHCFFTTLHPWLSYQNLLDGSLKSVSNPGHYWTDFSLGRSCVSNLIPKDTTAVAATISVLPNLSDKLDAISYRIPTSVVVSSDITAMVENDAGKEEIKKLFVELSKSNSKVFGYVEDNEFRVSCDYLRGDKSVYIDSRWTKILGKRMVKLVVWYDNEWGYSSKVIDILRYVFGD